MREHYPAQYFEWRKSHRHSAASQWLLNALAVVPLFWGGLQSDRVMRLGGFVLSFLAAGGAAITSQRKHETGELLGAHQRFEKAGMESMIQKALASTKAVSYAGLEPFQPYAFDDVLRSGTGIALLGDSGSGKSCIAQYLAAKVGPLVWGAPQVQILVLDPENDGQTWGQLPVIDDIELIRQQLHLLMNDLDRTRNSNRKQQRPNAPFVVIADEWPMIRLYCQKQKDDIADEFLLGYGSRARKMNAFPIFCSQSGNTKALGMEGLGDFLTNFSLIRLNDIALKYAKNLRNASELTERLQSVGYACMVGDEISTHPTHGHYPAVRRELPPANVPGDLRSLPLTVPLSANLETAVIEDRQPNPDNVARVAPQTSQLESLLQIDQPTHLNQELSNIYQLSLRKGWLTASKVKQFCRPMRRFKPEEIRQFFLELIQIGMGSTRGDGESLEWKAPGPD